MVEIAVYMSGSTQPQRYDAAKILAWVNREAPVEELQKIHWAGVGKKKFLMGEVRFAMCAVAIELTEAEADEAIKEYKEMGYRYG
jgi:hypothetical protein